MLNNEHFRAALDTLHREFTERMAKEQDLLKRLDDRRTEIARTIYGVDYKPAPIDTLMMLDGFERAIEVQRKEIDYQYQVLGRKVERFLFSFLVDTETAE